MGFYRRFDGFHECNACGVLLADEPAAIKHDGWHRAETERWERSLRREDSRWS